MSNIKSLKSGRVPDTKDSNIQLPDVTLNWGWHAPGKEHHTKTDAQHHVMVSVRKTPSAI